MRVPHIDISIKDLPSKGIMYNPNATVSYTPYTYGEVSYVSDSKLNLSRLLDFIAEGIQFSEGVDNLTYEDFWYIALLRRLSSLGSSDYKVEFRCKHCKSLSVEIFSQVGFDDIRAEALPIVCDIDSKEVEIYPVTYKDYKTLIESSNVSSPAMLAIGIKNMEFSEALDLVTNAIGEDIETLNTVDQYLYHGVSKLEAKCEHCSKTNYVDLTDHKESIIRPFRREEGSPANRIRFGKNRDDKSVSDTSS